MVCASSRLTLPLWTLFRRERVRAMPGPTHNRPWSNGTLRWLGLMRSRESDDGGRREGRKASSPAETLVEPMAVSRAPHARGVDAAAGEVVFAAGTAVAEALGRTEFRAEERRSPEDRESDRREQRVRVHEGTPDAGEVDVNRPEGSCNGEAESALLDRREPRRTLGESESVERAAGIPQTAA